MLQGHSGHFVRSIVGIRSVVLRCLRALVVGCLTAGFLVLLPQVSTAAPALALSRSTVIAGETVTVTGTVGGKASRPVVLQRRHQGVWVRLLSAKTSRSGAFRFSYRPPSTGKAGIAIRALAPAGKVGARRLAVVRTTVRTITTAPTSARIHAPTTATATEPVVVTGAFAPARAGRATELQRWDGLTWTRVASGKQDRSGTSTFEVGLATPGVRPLRVRTLPAGGAPATTSRVHEVTVADAPSEDPALPDGPTGVSAIAGDREAIVTWDASEDALGYRIHRAPALTGPWTPLGDEPLGPEHEATFTAGDLVNGTTYAFAVTSLHPNGVESRLSPAELVTPGRTPDAEEPVGACGPAPLKADGTPWTCTLAEDFDGTTYDKTRWFPQQTFASGTPETFACYRNTPETIAVARGVLSLSVVRTDEPTSCSFGKLSGTTDVIAGSLMSYQRFTQQYGRFEARIRTEETTFPGLQEAFWMWPDDRVRSEDKWPVAGEIDVSETYSVRPDLTIPFLHYRADSGGSQPGVNTAYCAAARGVWNTYTLVWSASRLEIQVNQKSCLVNTSGDSAFQKPYLLAFTAMLGVGDNAYDGRAPLPATMQVDYVRAWE